MSSAMTEYAVSSGCIPVALCCRGGASGVADMFVSCDSKIYADHAIHRQVETTTKVGLISDSDKREMYERFQSWAVQNYGDSGKTKTVTRKKYQRIVRTLTGEDYCSGENSKFRFWVKGKGFRLGPIGCAGQNSLELYVPTKSVVAWELGRPETCMCYGHDLGATLGKIGPGGASAPPPRTPTPATLLHIDRVGIDRSLYSLTVNFQKTIQNDPDVMDTEKSFKKVAVVEDFFDIIYGVHVEMDGRGGRHAGQKRTYRAIAETYSFLPREAVTRFLMSCNDCQKRMHLTFETNNNNVSTSDLPLEDNVIGDPALIDYTVPITQTYLNRMRSKAIECTNYFRDEFVERKKMIPVQIQMCSPSPCCAIHQYHHRHGQHPHDTLFGGYTSV